MDADAVSRVHVDSPVYSSDRQFYKALTTCTDNAKAKDVFVFVHGFNVTMEHAVARAAQMAEDMPFHGVVVAFSWPSVGRGNAYLTDEVQAERFFWSLAELLANLRSHLSADTRLHLLAHSMGNRVTLRALNALVGAVGPTGQSVDPFVAAQLSRFTNEQYVDHREQLAVLGSPDAARNAGLGGLKEITTRFPQWGTWAENRLSRRPLASLILAAPDVDAREFDVLVGNIRHVAGRMTLYASDSDYALEASRKVHGGAFRAGDSRVRSSVEGLQTVRVSGVSANDPLGHSYYGSNPVILTQLAQLLRPPVDLTKPVGTLAREQAFRTLR